MAYVLNIAYLLLLVVASPWMVYAAIRHGKYREGWAQRFWGQTPRRASERPCLWFHAVSVGEVNLLSVLLREIERQLPEYECVISTTTRTGYQLARARHPDRIVFYSPLDFTWSVQRALRRLQPELLVLVELELWPNWLRAARRQGIPIAIVNGRLSDASWRGYRRWRWLVRRWLGCLATMGVQNHQYAERFADLGAPRERIHVTGSIKFDGVRTDRQNPATAHCRQLAGLHPDDVVLLAGSTQDPEERLVLQTFQQLADEFPQRQLKLILVPRHPERFADVAHQLERSGFPWRRRTDLEHHVATDASPIRIVLVDVVGELGAWWGTADIGFVGGSLTQRGGQNMIEPTAYGVATCFGPHTHNFRDVVELLLQHQAAVVVSNDDDLTAFVRRCLSDPAYRQALGQRAQQLVCQQGGATVNTVDLLKRLLAPPTVASDVTAGAGVAPVGRPPHVSRGPSISTRQFKE